jgi:hypothetical protein
MNEEDILIPIDKLEKESIIDESEKPIIQKWIEDLHKNKSFIENKPLIDKIFRKIIEYDSISQEMLLGDIKNKLGNKISKKILVGFLDSTKRIYAEKKIKIVKKKKDIDNRFYRTNLLEEIYNEIDHKHKLDHKEKLALFIIRVSAELNSPSDRVSCALKGDSSAGKDNIFKSVLELFPEIDNFILTRGTQSALEEEANYVKCIAFSEINANRENGANANLTEVFKQLSEGGTSVLKRDQKTHDVIHINTEQKTLIYATTETESDEELTTRYVVIPVKGYQIKNKIVVDSNLDKISTPEKYLENDKRENWIADGIKLLDHDIEVIIPYAIMLKEKIKDIDGKEKYLFDFTKERIKRDAKRLISLTKAMAWLHQKQRTKKLIKNQKFLFAEPSDFLVVLQLFAEFFNLTYYGIDHRLEKCLKKIYELETLHDAEIMQFGYDSKYYRWVLRHKLAEELGIQSITTIKKYILELEDLQLIETHYDISKPRGTLIKGIKQGISKVSLPISWQALTPYLISYLIPSNMKKIYEKKEVKEIKISFLDDKVLEEKKKERDMFGKMAPSKMTPSFSENMCNKKILKKDNVIEERIDIDFGAENEKENKLIRFIQKNTKKNKSLVYDNFDLVLIQKLSKQGIIYENPKNCLQVKA